MTDIAERIVLDPNKLYTIKQIVCDWLGYRRVRWFYDNREYLKRQGFPKPIPKPGQPRWRGDALIAWSQKADDLAEELRQPGTNVTSLAERAQQSTESEEGVMSRAAIVLAAALLLIGMLQFAAPNPYKTCVPDTGWLRICG